MSHKLGRFILWWKITLCFLLSWVLDLCDCTLVRIIEVTVFAGRVKTTDLVNMIFNFCELYSGKTMFPYQAQFSKRVIRSILLNDGEEITALFARQSGKSETIAITVGGLMIMLPQLANMPMFAGDTRLEMFKDGLWVGIFAPGKRQAEITYNRVRQRLQCKTALAVMQDPEFNLYFHTSNGQTCSLSNGSFVTCISASDQSNIEGESFKLIICEECQDISNYKIRKCLTGDTLVLTDSGKYKRLDEIVKDQTDSVVCYDSTMSYLQVRKPKEYLDNGVQDVYKITLDNGETIKATENHQFYTYNQKTHGEKCAFRTVKQIKDSMCNDRPLRIGVPARLPYFSDEKQNDYEEGLILGYFLGDGCTVATPKFIGDIPTCNRLYDIIRRCVDPDIKMTETHYNEQNGMLEVCFSTETNKKYSNSLRNFFMWYGLADKTGVDKKLPENTLYSKQFYRGLIEGLIETDGSIECCCTKPVISFAGISKHLVEQVKEILNRFGVHSTIHSVDNTGGLSKNSKTLWLLHIKSVHDIRLFAEEFVLFRKQVYLNEALETVKDKEDREVSKYYSEEMRFCAVKGIEYVGKEHTYCLSVEGRNFIANNMISSNSIHPMGAAYNATIVKIGTATTFKGDFYDAIQRNKTTYEQKKKEYRKRGSNISTLVRNHFEYDYKVAAKYNPKYAKYVEQEMKRLGENSDEFRMAYKLEWIIERGMFVDIDKFEVANGEPMLERVSYDKKAKHVAGIDVGGKNDDTIITIVEVDWSMPVIMEERTEDSGQRIMYEAYNTFIVDWCCIANEPDYEIQYNMIIHYLNNFWVVRVVCDATREASLAHRLRANLRCEVIPYIFTTVSKSELYKLLDTEISSGRARVPCGDATKETKEYKSFMKQLGDLQKGWSGAHMVCCHGSGKDDHDDYCDSWALAVWGASSKGEENNTETRENKFMKKTPNEKTANSRRNCLTARRMRRR